MDTLYARLKAANVPMENHYSDLYVPDTDKVRAIIATHPDRVYMTRFVSQIDGKVWIDLPFAYEPWWTRRQS